MALLQVAIVFATAFLVTFCAVPLSRKIAVVLGAIDQPGYRRVNKGPVPRCGGIALYLGLCAAFLVAYVGLRFFGWQLRDLYTLNGINYIELFVGITVMFAVGLVDDVTRLSPKMKLLGQIIAACIVVASGVSIGMVHTAFASTGGYYALGWLDFPLTVAYLVVFVNITNLIDGLDGLASGLVAIACSSLLFLVWQRGSMTMALVCVAVIGVCLAFLRYNFFPASVFMILAATFWGLWWASSRCRALCVRKVLWSCSCLLSSPAFPSWTPCRPSFADCVIMSESTMPISAISIIG